MLPIKNTLIAAAVSNSPPAKKIRNVRISADPSMRWCSRCPTRHSTAFQLLQWPLRLSLIEHGRDLLDVDAFLGHTQFVVSDRDDDRGEGISDCGPDRGADECQGLASCGRQHPLKEQIDQAEGDQQEHDPEDLPAMALGQ